MRSVDACMIGRARSQSPWTLILHDCVACGRTSYYLIKYTPNSAPACPLLEIIIIETGRTNVQEYRVDNCVDKAEKEMPARPKDSATPGQHGCIQHPLKEICENIANLSDRFTTFLPPDLQVQQNQRSHHVRCYQKQRSPCYVYQ